MKKIVYTATVVAAVSLTGCWFKSDKGEAPAPADEASVEEATPEPEFTEPDDPLYKLFQQAETLYSAGSIDDTLKLLSDALGSEEYAVFKPQILPTLVRLYIEKGDIDTAKQRVLDTYKSGDETLSDSVLGSIYFHYTNSGDNAAALAWTDEVLAIENLSPRARRSFSEWNITAAIEADDDARVANAAEALFTMAPANDAAEILRRSMDTLVTRGKIDLLADIIARAGKSVTSDAATRNLIAVMRLRILAMQGKWDELAAAFATTTSLPDKELHYALRSTIPQALKAERYATIDAICEKIVSNPENARLSTGYAARQWLDSAQKTDLAKVPERIDKLIGGPVQHQDIVSILVRHAYDNIDDPAFATPMKALAERLLAATPEDSRSSLRTVILDYSFILEDYDSALALLAEGFTGYDENWHNMAISKVKAHKALKEDRKLDAIREFRTFMSVIQTSEEETTDPATGIVHTRDMILGRNAARIGNIYASIPDPENAARAYAEARDYYNTALGKARDEDTLEVIRKELAEIPAAQ